MAPYSGGAAVEKIAIRAYMDTHPADMDNPSEEIITRYWGACCLNGSEAWANFRRSNYPARLPNPDPGSEIREDFICRMPYPDSGLPPLSRTGRRQSAFRVLII